MFETTTQAARTTVAELGGTPADADQAILFRLRDTARLIERMLHDERRQRYFDALSLKRSGGLSGNVTALFFGDPAATAVPEV